MRALVHSYSVITLLDTRVLVAVGCFLDEADLHPGHHVTKIG